MKRKGQYLAIETVLSLGLSLVVAIAAIGIFTNYRDSVMDTIHDRHSSAVKSEVMTAIYNLREADSGSFIEVDIPQPDRGSYRVALTEGTLRIEMGGDTETTEIQGARWVSEFRGSAESSSVRIMKLNENIILRPG